MSLRFRDALAGAAWLFAVVACKREERMFREVPATAEDSAWAVNEGQRLYRWYNCVGCHAHGGGGMGPPLMDAKWIYGSSPEDVYSSIVDGRPNGMPAFRGKILESE